MTMKFQPFVAEGIAQMSYLVGDTTSGTAAVVDPRPDCDVYVEYAQSHGLAITHVFETHNHADFMSGARELAHRTGGAHIVLSQERGQQYGFDHTPMADGDTFTFGSVTLVARHTPGHTPEHMALCLQDKGSEEPWGVCTGDALFVGSVGRPDLLGGEHTGDLTKDLYKTLHDVFLKMSDDVMIFPCHGQGSACGASIGDRPFSTIGWERRHNPFLQTAAFDDFKTMLEENAPPVPNHYPRLKKVNAQGPEILATMPGVPALTASEFQERIDTEPAPVVLDTRDMLAFGGGHIPGAINIGARPQLSVYAGWLLDPDRPLLLVLPDDEALAFVTSLLHRTGFTRCDGYLADGMVSWAKAGQPIATVPQLDVHSLHNRESEIQILDVRKPGERDQGYIPGAHHCFIGDLGNSKCDGLDPARPVAVYCGSGYRASMAASLLKKQGFEDVRNVPGSWSAWTNEDLPVAP